MIIVRTRFSHAGELKPHLVHVWDVFCQYSQTQWEEVESEPHITIGFGADCEVHFSNTFKNQMEQATFEADKWFGDELMLKMEDGSNDYLGTAFYLVNCLQEYGETELDHKQRFRFDRSVQHAFGVTQQNVVAHLFNRLIDENDSVAKLFKKPKRISKIIITHDIDKLYLSFLHDGFWALKKGRIDIILKLIFNEVVGKQEWKNIDRIMRMEDEYDVKAVFFWLANQGKVNAIESNADYAMESEVVQGYLKLGAELGHESGLHKSISMDSFQTEFQKLGFIPVANRYHHLKFAMPTDFPKIDTSGLKADLSLGFAEEHGFRNSYGLPLKMFDPVAKKPYAFVQIPLSMMDNTFRFYNGKNPEETWKEMYGFMEANKSNCVLSVLWHNPFFTPYKFGGYLKCFKNLLGYMKEEQIGYTTIAEILDEYG